MSGISGITFDDVKDAVRAYGVKGEADVTAVAQRAWDALFDDEDTDLGSAVADAEKEYFDD